MSNWPLSSNFKFLQQHYNILHFGKDWQFNYQYLLKTGNFLVSDIYRKFLYWTKQLANKVLTEYSVLLFTLESVTQRMRCDDIEFKS